VPLEIHRFIEENLEQPVELELAHGTAVIYTHCAEYKDNANEDAVCLMERENGDSILALADGVGGERGGSLASKIMLETLIDNFKANVNQDLQGVVLNSVDLANQSILEQGVGAATTIAAVGVHEGIIRPYHVGDSDILLVGQRGLVKFQSIPHSPTGYAIEAGMLHEDDATGHEDRHYVSNVVGSADMHIDIGPILKMSKRDRLLIMSDGVSDNLLNQEIIEIIRSGPIRKAANQLLAACLDRMKEEDPYLPGKPDDLSFILYQLA